jgi:hypothetical protein
MRFDGPSSRIIWADGTTEKIGDGEKLHGFGDTRLWYLTVGINKMAKKGFVLTLLTDKDAYLVRSNTIPVKEYACVRYTGPDCGIIWPDGTTERVAKKSEKPEDADIRLWYLTRAMNTMSKRGYSFKKTFGNYPILPFGHNIDFVDMWMERTLVPEKE